MLTQLSHPGALRFDILERTYIRHDFIQMMVFPTHLEFKNVGHFVTQDLSHKHQHNKSLQEPRARRLFHRDTYLHLLKLTVQAL